MPERTESRTKRGNDAVGLQQPLVEEIGAIAGVAGEQFVAAFAGEDDFDLLARPGVRRNRARRWRAN